MMSYRLTRFPHVRDSKGATAADWSGDDLEAFLASAQPYAGERTDLPIICPATFTNGHRKLENVIAVSMLPLDVDTGTPDPRAMAERVSSTLGGVELFAHSTYSSTADAWRMRFFVPYATPVGAAVHKGAWSFIQRALSDEAAIQIDTACSDASRACFEPCIPPSGLYFHAHIHGEAFPAELAADADAKWIAAKESATLAAMPARPVARHAPGSALDRARRYLSAVPGAVSGQHGHATTFTVAAKLVRGFDLSDSEALSLLTDWNRSCRPPWKPRELARKVREARASRSFTPGFLLEGTR